MSSTFIDLDVILPSGEQHGSSLQITDRIAPHGRVQAIGVIPHCAKLKPRTRNDRDALVLFLMSIEYAEENEDER